MNIIVCIKQVPDTEAQIKIGPDGKSIAEERYQMDNESL